MRLLNFLLLPLAAAASALPGLSGLWYQTFSSHFLQSSFEIDWKCVQVEVLPVEENSYQVFRTARLHGGPVIYRPPPATFEYVNSTLVSPPFVYDVHVISNKSTVVLTDEFQPFIYVFERNLSRRHSGAQIEKKLVQWGIELNYDTSLVESYDPDNCTPQ